MAHPLLVPNHPPDGPVIFINHPHATRDSRNRRGTACRARGVTGDSREGDDTARRGLADDAMGGGGTGTAGTARRAPTGGAMADGIPRRRSIRLNGYDYAQVGVYFVTVCTQNRLCLFGDVVDGEMVLNDAGRVVACEWMKTAERRPDIAVDEFVTMPNHFHGVVVICGPDGLAGTARRAPTVERFGQPVSGSLSTIIRAFKSAVTRGINETRNSPGSKLWQRNFHEHLVRGEEDLDRIREYIICNPGRWASDRENPRALVRPAGTDSVSWLP